MTTTRNVADDPVMTVYLDEQEEGVRTVVLRGPASVCAYLGVPIGHPLADQSYDDLSMEVHGGLTFAGTFKELPGWYFYGWDYCHAGDKTLYDAELRAVLGRDRYDRKEHEWTVEEVTQEARAALYDFRRLVRLAERITRKAADQHKPSLSVSEEDK